MSKTEDSTTQKIDAICQQFKECWSADHCADVGSYLTRIHKQHRNQLLAALLKVDVELRVGANQSVNPNDYRELGDRAVELVRSLLIPHNQTIIPGKLSESAPLEPQLANFNRQIGPYRLLEQIGEGGMGTVWMAEQESPVRRRVALKLIRRDLSSNVTIARFEAERQALATMSHENIAKVLDAGQTEDGSPFFVMELINGIPLTEYCDRNKLDIRERLKLFLFVCGSVQHAHSKGIIHRDLKPSNVLVAIQDNGPIPKVIDFGLAKALNPTTKLTDQTLITEFGSVLGTLQYMAPEQADANGRDVDIRTDVYQLGIMLFVLLVGSTPLTKEDLNKQDLIQLLARISQGLAPRPSSRICDVNDTPCEIANNRNTTRIKLQRKLQQELDWVVLKAIEKDQNRRYQTVGEMANDIQAFLDGNTVEARPPSWSYQLRKFSRRNKSVLTTGSVMLITLLTASIFSFTSYLREREITRRLQQKSIERAIEAAAVENLKRANDEITAAELDDPTPWLKMIAAFESRKNGNSDRSIEQLEAAQSLLPDNKIIQSMLADAYLTGGRWENYTRLPVSKGLITPNTDFERIFIGHALAWTNTTDSQKMLIRAVENTRLPLAYVYLARTNASIARTTINVELAELAVKQANLGAELLPNSAIAQTNQIYAQTCAFDLYQKLLKQNDLNLESKQELELRSQQMFDLLAATVSQIEIFELSHQAMVCAGLYFRAAGTLDLEASEFERAEENFEAAQQYFRQSAQAFPFVFEHAFLSGDEQLSKKTANDLIAPPFGSQRSLFCRYLLLRDLGRDTEANRLLNVALESALPNRQGWVIDLALIGGHKDRAEQLARGLLANYESEDRGIRVDFLKFNARSLTQESIDSFIQQAPVVARGGKYFAVGLRLLVEGERNSAVRYFEKAEFYSLPLDTVGALARSFSIRLSSDATWPAWLGVDN